MREVKVEEGILEVDAVVKKLERSKIPRVFIATIEDGGLKITLDLVKDLLVFKEGDKVRVTLSRNLPKFEEGRDLLIWGYVLSKKVIRRKEEPRKTYKLLISLWGYLMVIESKTDNVNNAFSIMDKVYLKISVI